MCSGQAATAEGLGLGGLDTAALLEVVSAALDRLGADPLSNAVTDDALLASTVALQRLESSVHAEKLRRIAELDLRKTAQAQGERSTADLVGSALGLTPAEARRQAATAEAMSRLPATAKQLAAGRITAAHADAAARGLAALDRHSDQRQRDAGTDMDAWTEAVDDADRTAAAYDAFAAEQASTTDANRMSQQLNAWTNAHDPDLAAARERRALARRGVWIGDQPDADGIITSTVRAGAEQTARLRAALDVRAPKTSADDTRTLAQRRHDALMELAGSPAGPGVGPAGAGAQVLLVTTPAAQAGEPDAPAPWLDGVGPVSRATAEAIACGAETTIVTIDEQRRVWDVGRSDGTPSTRQRQAVIARDVACIGCNAYVSRCQIHHVRWKSQGGPTTVDNLVLVCWSCHQGLHHLGWQVTRQPDGRHAITKPTRAGPAPPV